MQAYATLEELLVATAEAVRPRERISVSEGAERYHGVPSSLTGKFDLSKTPYLREPMDVLSSLRFNGMVFVGPARTGKSAMFINWLCHTALTNPTDMMMVHMAQHAARSWSKSDLDKAIRHSPELRAAMLPGRQNDNTFDKMFLSGMRFELTWPTEVNLSGKTVPYTWIPDYDREPIEVEGKGDKWSLTMRRGQTAGRYRMHAAETSPGFAIEDPKWQPSTPHEAPPTKGLLSVYNDGDRRRWNWACPQCRGAFEPHRRLLSWPDSRDPAECAAQVVMVCPHDGFPMQPEMQFELNLGGQWVKEGQMWVPGARDPLVGTPRLSKIGSFWMFGPAAGFSDWGELVSDLRAAELDYENTLSEDKLRTVITTGFGEPYLPKALEGTEMPDTLEARARHAAAKGEVPEGVVALLTMIDVQKQSFVCHNFGLEPVRVEAGWMIDIHHVDMWKIAKSRRLDADGEHKPIDPASHPEDWDVLIDEVLLRTYPLADGSGRRMAVKLAASDSGGAASAAAARLNAALAGPKVSVTSNAYAFWRRLRDDPQARQLHQRFHLLKGEPSNSKPLLMRTLPDSLKKDQFAIARGDVPLWAVNSNKAKDKAHVMLGRDEPGGQVRFPVWFDEGGKPLDIGWLYRQLTSEIRVTAGWRNPARRRNEAFDLLSYLVAFFDHPDIRLHQINWASPPPWARPWDTNALVVGADGESPIDGKSDRKRLADLAGDLG